MYGMLILLGTAAWLAIAISPIYFLLKYRKWLLSVLLGLPLMLTVLAAPFWDYFFMVPAINDAYEKFAISKVYKVSNARSIYIVRSENGVGKVTNEPVYKDALWAGKLDFIEALGHTEFVYGKRPQERLKRYTVQAAESEACRLRAVPQSTKEGRCIAYEFIEIPTAEVLIEMGTNYVTPRKDFPNKRFEYSFWRATDFSDNKKLSELAHNFIWDPQLCYWFNACRYVVDRDESVVTQYRSVKSAVPALLN